MGRNHFETVELLGASCWALDAERRQVFSRKTSASRPAPSAFTLTELLVVITIIAILAGLITGAAVNALRRAKQSTITLEISQLANSLEDFKNTYGAYPPNGMVPVNPVPVNNIDTPTKLISDITQQDFILMFKKAFPRHKEPQGLIQRLAGNNQTGLVGDPSTWATTTHGMTGAEALVFWLGGFSDDPIYPVSGPGGPSFADTRTPAGLDPGDEVLEDRNRRYEFDLGRLGPRDNTGVFNGRFIDYLYTLPAGGTQNRRINLWTYVPSGSQLPLVYLDTSRHDPVEYDVALLGTVGTPTPPRLYGLKTLREGLATSNNLEDLVFVNKGKFQILHAGIDDIWGEGFWNIGLLDMNGTTYKGNVSQVLLFPTGPFLGDVADTVGNFGTGTLADEQE
jgi:prepilin-type N-terminal cleavage/methylation domain-containing protein